MTTAEITHDEWVALLTNDISVDRRREIETAAEADDELAAQIVVLGGLANLFFGLRVIDTPETVDSNRNRVGGNAEIKLSSAESLPNETIVAGSASSETIGSLSPGEALQKRVLEQLTDEHRKFYQWRMLDGQSADEIARRVGLTRKEVQLRIKAARTQFDLVRARIETVAEEATAEFIKTSPPSI